MGDTILLIDNDAAARCSMALSLEQAGYKVNAAPGAPGGPAVMQRDPPDLALLDMSHGGPGGPGMLHSFQVRADIPVILIIARGRELDQVLGLELGADDCIARPFEFNVLLARVRAVIRRNTQMEKVPDRLAVGDLVIRPTAHAATLAGKALDLAPREFDLLYVLAANAGKIVSIDDLLSQVWGAGYEGEAQSIYIHIRWLREKLETDPGNPQRIVTVRGVGYKLEAIEASRKD